MITPETVLNKLGIPFFPRTGRLAIHCPFHHDTDPSAAFYHSSDLFYCFACNEPMNTVKFYARVKDISYEEAKRELGLTLGELEEKKRGNPLEIERARKEGEAKIQEEVAFARESARGPLQEQTFLLTWTETLDRIIMAYDRGQIDEGQLHRAMANWKGLARNELNNQNHPEPDDHTPQPDPRADRTHPATTTTRENPGNEAEGNDVDLD